MARRVVPFRQADVTRAVKGAMVAGLTIARVEIDRSGRIVIIHGQPDEPSGESAELDRELARFGARDEGSA